MKTGFWWSDRNVQFLKERFASDGPKKLAKELGTTPVAVSLKARRMGIVSGRGRQSKYEWTEDMESTLIRMYPTASRLELEQEFDLPNHAIRTKARKLGLQNVVRHQLSGKSKSENSSSCDYKFFDTWTNDSAYVLGFLFADGSVTKRQCDVVIAVAEQDECVLHYINKVTKNKRKLFYKEAQTDRLGIYHSKSVWATLSNRLLVNKLMSVGMLPGKTRRDDPFPDIPITYMPHFVRGYFDGDGTAFVTNQGHCRIGLVGTPLMIEGISDALVLHAGMSKKKKTRTVGKTATWSKVFWGSTRDISLFRQFIYPYGFSFCLNRKKSVIDKWLDTH